MSATLAALLLAGSAAAPLCFAQSDTDALTARWLSLEVQRGKLKSSWDSRKILLDQQLALLEAEAATLREVIAEHASSATEAEQERADLLAEQTSLERQQEEMSRAVDIAAHKLAARLIRLPPPLQQKWGDQIARVANADRPLSDRLDETLQILSAIDEFEQRVFIVEGNLELPGVSAHPAILHVTQVYLGASRGWYVSSDGSHYGYGESGDQGWRWWHGKEARSALQQPLDPYAVQALIRATKNPDKAALTGLPIAIDLPTSMHHAGAH